MTYICTFLGGVIVGMVLWGILFKTINAHNYIETDDIIIKRNKLVTPLDPMAVVPAEKVNIFKKILLTFKKKKDD
jgi:hypothetical protein